MPNCLPRKSAEEVEVEYLDGEREKRRRRRRGGGKRKGGQTDGEGKVMYVSHLCFSARERQQEAARGPARE